MGEFVLANLATKADISEVKAGIEELRAATKADLIALEKKFTVYFLVLMFTVIFLNQNALEFIAHLLGLVH